MSNPQKVYFFVRTIPVLSQTFVINQIKDLKNEGLDVHVLAVNPVVDESSILNSIFGSELNDKIESILPGPHSKKSWIIMIFSMLFCAVSKSRWVLLGVATRFIKKKNFFLAKDLLCLAWYLKDKDIEMENCIAHFGNNGVVIDYLRNANLVSCKNLFTIFHGYEISRYDQLSVWQKEYRKLGGLLLPISKHWEEALISFGVKRSNIKVIHMGVDVDTFTFKDKEISPQLQVLTVARATEKKGLKYAIEAILNATIDCHLTLIGDGQLLPGLKQMVTEHNNSERVTFLGACPPYRVAEELKKTDLFLLPSIQDDSGDKEGIPVSLMEAMASGVVVLSTYHSGIPELIEHGKTGFLVKEKDSKALSSMISAIAKRDDLRDIRLNAREKIENDFNARTLKNDLVRVLTHGGDG